MILLCHVYLTGMHVLFAASINKTQEKKSKSTTSKQNATLHRYHPTIKEEVGAKMRNSTSYQKQIQKTAQKWLQAKEEIN